MENNAGKQAAKKREKMRERLWPNSAPVVFDPSDRTTKGYSQTPRVVPLVGRLVNEIGGTENAGSLYQVLWAQDWGQGIVEVRSFRGLLYEAGYNGKGPRVERTWLERIGILARLGFVKTAPRGLDSFGYVLLVDPHLAVLALQKDAGADIDRQRFDAWFQQFCGVCDQWGIDLEAYGKKLVAVEEVPQ